MDEIILINGQEVKKITYKGQTVITFRMVDDLHERPEGTARRNFNENKDHFVEGEEYFRVPYEEWSKILSVCAADSPTDDTAVRNSSVSGRDTGQRNPMVFLTEAGYLLLVKSFTDPLAWKVQKQLIKCYFTVQKIAEDVKKGRIFSYPEGKNNVPTNRMTEANLAREAWRGNPLAIHILQRDYDVPVADLLKQKADGPQKTMDVIATFAEYLRLICENNFRTFGLDVINPVEGSYRVKGYSQAFFKTFTEISRLYKLPRLFMREHDMRWMISRETDRIREAGWEWYPAKNWEDDPFDSKFSFEQMD